MENNPPVNDETQNLLEYIKTLEEKVTKKDSVINYLQGQNRKLILSSHGSTNSIGSLQTAVSESQFEEHHLFHSTPAIKAPTPEENTRKRQRVEFGDSLIISSKRPRNVQLSDLNPEAEYAQIDDQSNVLLATAKLNSVETSPKLQQGLDEANRKIAELELKVVEVNKQCGNYSIQFASLHRALDEASKQVSFFSHQSAEFIKLLTEHEEIRRAKLSVETELQEMTEQNISLKSQLDLQKQEIVGLELGLKESKIKVADLIKQIEDASKGHNQLVHDLEAQASTKLSQKDYVGSMELWLQAIGVEQSGHRKDVIALANFWGNIATCWSHGLNRTDLAFQAIENAISLDSSNPLFYHDRAVYAERLSNLADPTVDLNDAYGESKLAEFDQK